MSEHKEHPIDKLGVLSEYVDDLGGLVELLLRTHEADSHAIKQAASRLQVHHTEEIFGTPTPYRFTGRMTQGEWGGVEGVATALLGRIHQQIQDLEKALKSVQFENALMRSEMETHGPAIQASAMKLMEAENKECYGRAPRKGKKPSSEAAAN